MEALQHLHEALQALPGWVKTLFLILAVWELFWKMIALWQSARKKQVIWFICIGILNTVGILPIIYLLGHQKKQASSTSL